MAALEIQPSDSRAKLLGSTPVMMWLENQLKVLVVMYCDVL
jgi:hypothetical protein